MNDQVVSLPQLAVGAEEAAAMLGISRTSLLRGDKSGEIGPTSYRIGGRRLWATEELGQWGRAGMPPRGRWTQIWATMQGDR